MSRGCPICRGPVRPEGNCVRCGAWWTAPVTRSKPILTLDQAREAVVRDRLATVYWRGRRAFIVTAFGSADFSRGEWGGDRGQKARACGSLGRPA